MLPYMYGTLTFGPLHDLHVGISKMLNLTVIAYLSSDENLNNLGHMPKKLKPSIQVQKAVARGGNAYLTAIEIDGRGTRLKVYTSRSNSSPELNERFTSIDELK